MSTPPTPIRAWSALPFLLLHSMSGYWQNPVVHLSVRNAVHCVPHGRCTLAKSCTSVFLAGKFLFVHSDTFAVGCIVYHKTHRKKTSRRKCEPEFFFRHRWPRVHWFIAYYLLLRTWVDRHRGLSWSRLNGFSFRCVQKRTAGTKSDFSRTEPFVGLNCNRSRFDSSPVLQERPALYLFFRYNSPVLV